MSSTRWTPQRDLRAGAGEGDDSDGGGHAGGDAHGGDRGGPGGGSGAGGWCSSSRAAQYAEALVDIAAVYLGGDTDAPGAGGPGGGGAAGEDGDLSGSGGVVDGRRRAKPLFVPCVDVADVTVANAAHVQLDVRGRPTTLSWACLEQLCVDATLRTVLFDGATPLAVAERTRQASVPAATRLGVAARDRGDRLPGSHDPIGWTDVHHLRAQAEGGDHHPNNLIALSRRSHTLVHRHNWTVTLDPASGLVTMTRGDTTIRSLPAGTRLSRPPGTGPPERPPPRPRTGQRARARGPDTDQLSLLSAGDTSSDPPVAEPAQSDRDERSPPTDLPF